MAKKIFKDKMTKLQPNVPPPVSTVPTPSPSPTQ
jgi:hypothetical protein